MKNTEAKTFPAAGTGVRLKNPLVSDGRMVALRMPTDEEYAALRRRMDMVSGRRDEELALADGLLRELATDGAAGIDPDAADYILGRLVSFTLTRAKIDPDRGDFEVRAVALGGVEVGIRFKLPSVRRLREDQALTLALAEKLFDEFVTETEGYAGAVPNYHKHSAALALVDGLFGMAAEVEEADFFDLTAPMAGEARPSA